MSYNSTDVPGPRFPNTWLRAAALVAVLALLAVSAFAAVPEHSHDARACVVCYAAHLPSIQQAAVAVEHDTAIIALDVAAPVSAVFSSGARTLSIPRAPPV